MVGALYWRFWQLPDGASLGDPAIAALSKTGNAASGDAMLQAPEPSALESILAASAG